MTKPDSDKQYGILAAIAVGLGILIFGAVSWLMVGIFTHVIGMCSGASREWTQIYDFIFLSIPALAIGGAIASYKRFKSKRQQPKSPTKED